MLQQTRIDQFYKSTSGKQVSNVMTNSKKNVKLKSIPYTRNVSYYLILINCLY